MSARRRAGPGLVARAGDELELASGAELELERQCPRKPHECWHQACSWPRCDGLRRPELELEGASSRLELDAAELARVAEFVRRGMAAQSAVDAVLDEHRRAGDTPNPSQGGNAPPGAGKLGAR